MNTFPVTVLSELQRRARAKAAKTVQRSGEARESNKSTWVVERPGPKALAAGIQFVRDCGRRRRRQTKSGPRRR